MPQLLEVQRAFARTMVSTNQVVMTDVVGGAIVVAERFSIYRNTSRITLTAALRISYPAVDALVGGDFFDMAAARFMRSHLPRSGCLNDYGEGFPAFLESMDATASVPYLGDVARFEWALGQAAIAPDAPVISLSALANIDGAMHGEICFVPHPSVHLLNLRYPADRIADAVLADDGDALAALNPGAQSTMLLVHRGAGGLAVERLDAASYRLLTQIFSGMALGALCEATGCAVGRLLGEQIANGRISGMQRSQAHGVEAAA